jgi:hypothetical protein
MTLKCFPLIGLMLFSALAMAQSLTLPPWDLIIVKED